MKRLGSAYDRLERADEHIASIKQLLREYYASDFAAFNGEFDLDANSVHVTGTIRVLPHRLHTLLGEVLHNFRSALDHLAWRLVEANRGTPDEDTSFPLLKDSPQVGRFGKNPAPGVYGGISKEASEMVGRAQPYNWATNWAHHPSWGLHHLNRVDKHRHNAIQGTALGGMWFVGCSQSFRWTAHTTSFTEHGAEVALVPDDPSLDMQGHTTIEVRLHETDIAGPGPGPRLLDLLLEIRDEVRRIIKDADDTCPELAG